MPSLQPAALVSPLENASALLPRKLHSGFVISSSLLYLPSSLKDPKWCRSFCNVRNFLSQLILLIEEMLTLRVISHCPTALLF